MAVEPSTVLELRGITKRFPGVVANGQFKGGTDVNFNLANGGMSVGKINPAVPQDLIDKMNALKQQIIDGKVKPPTSLG